MRHHHLAALLTLSAATAQSCIDQEYVTQRANGLEITGNQSVVQTFTCSRAGLLLRVDLEVRHWIVVATAPLTVNVLATDASGVPTNQVLLTAQLQPNEIPTGAYAWIPVRFTAPLVVIPNRVLGLELSVPAATVRAYAWSGDAPGGYPGGTTFVRRTTGPLSYDMGFRTYVGAGATQTGYGIGHAGSSGVPALQASALPRLGTDVDLALGNSAGVPTQGVLLFGVSRASLPTPYGGTLLVNPLLALPLPVPLGGARFPLAIPDDPSLCGLTLAIQGLVADAGASHGIAFSAGLELRFDP
jgi:hypothetical protein